MSNLKRWTNEEIQYLKDNYDKELYSVIGEKLQRSEGAIRAKCHDLRLVQKDEWTKEEEDFLKQNYYLLSISDLALILGRTENAVHIKGSKLGLKKYPYYCNEQFFDNIDNEEKAYWLGFLTADGWISKNSSSNSGVVGISLQYSDIDHLKKFNKSINGNYKITDRWRSCGVIGRDPNKKSRICDLRIFSIKLYNALERYGFGKDKTYTITMPNLSKDLVPHYLRGFFDGDGCFSYTKKSFGVSFLSASELLITSIKKNLDSINIDSSIVSFTSEYNTPMFRLYIYKKKDKLRLLDYMYENSSIYLERKYQKYLKAKQEPNY